MLKHAKASIVRSLDTNENKKDEELFELVSYSKSATDLVFQHQEVEKPMVISSNFLQLPGEQSRRFSTVSFSLLEDDMRTSLENLPALSRGGSVFIRVSDVLTTNRRPSIFSQLSYLANKSTRPSSVYSSLNDLSKNHPIIYSVFSRIAMFIFIVVVLLIIVVIFHLLFK